MEGGGVNQLLITDDTALLEINCDWLVSII